MIYDYDLIVLGETPAGRASAEYAARYRARVAWLVGPGAGSEATASPDSASRAWRGFHALRAGLMRSPSGQSRLELSPLELSLLESSPLQIFQQAQRLAQVSEGWENPAALAQLGVDVIEAPGRFEGVGRSHWGTPLGLRLPGRDRPLLARHYVLAPVAQPRIPQVAGLDRTARDGLCPVSEDCVPYDTLHTWLDWPTLPRSLTILGREPRGLALAQMLARLGCEVTVVSQMQCLKADATATHLLESLLQSEGVRLVLEVAVLTVSPAAMGQIQLEADGQVWQSDRLLLAAGWQPALEDAMGLAAAGLPADRKLDVNANLRTRHRQIYAIAAALGGDGYEAGVLEEARSTTRQVLFWPGFRRSSQRLVQPKIVWTLPPLVQMGLTPAQAQRRLGDRISLLTAHPQANLLLHLVDGVVGLVQLIGHPNGKLLGATLMGAEATEWSGAIALALQHGLALEDLAQLPCWEPSVAAMIQSAAVQWRWQQLRDPSELGKANRPRREDLWERFFNWRRTGGV